jgi:hypothetical protein
MHKHHTIPRSRGGSDEYVEYKSAYDHAYDHAVDFVLFEISPYFDCRHVAWPLLPKDLQEAVKREQSIRKKKEYVKDDLLFWGPEIENWYKSGLSTRQIGAILGRSAPAINYHLRLRGVELNPPCKGSRGKDLKPRKKDGYGKQKQLVHSGVQ